MTSDQLAARLVGLRPVLTNVIGFHELIDAGAAKTPFDAMTHQAHFTAASVKLAHDVLQIVNDLLDGPKS